MAYKVDLYKDAGSDERAIYEDYDWTVYLETAPIVLWDTPETLMRQLTTLIGARSQIEDTDKGARIQFQEKKQGLPPEESLRGRPLTIPPPVPPDVPAPEPLIALEPALPLVFAVVVGPISSEVPVPSLDELAEVELEDEPAGPAAPEAPPPSSPEDIHPPEVAAEGGGSWLRRLIS